MFSISETFLGLTREFGHGMVLRPSLTRHRWDQYPIRSYRDLKLRPIAERTNLD
jgi:hypothetical protein